MSAQQLGDPNCDSLLLVSSWSRDNVKIYDGCDGSYLRDLANPGILDGPQAIFQDHNGDVIVVSESNHRLVRFDQETLTEATTVVPPGLMENPITVVKKDDQHIFLASYSSNEIIEMNTVSWEKTRTILPANNGQIMGIDIGMAMGPDGHLYVPGYDSDSILKVNPDNGATQSFVASGSEGLDRPRSILFNGNELLVTAWGNQAIFNYSSTGQLLGTPVTPLPGAAGMIMDGPEHILVTSDTFNLVRRYQLNDFSFENVVGNSSGGLVGATYVYRLNKQPSISDVTDIRQAWMIGVGTIDGQRITVTEMAINTGGQFGADFDPHAISRHLWGQLTIDFMDCHHAEMSYASALSHNQHAFGAGGYLLQRVVMNQAGLNCDQDHFADLTDKSYMSGTFYGGQHRDGEGFSIDYLNENQVIVTWFTYLPAD
ncbi:hypothetical protein ACFODZ_14765 [Marinicella sediminis]|uniref:6-bladed beta-propeller n=1 Tax=Marinicella sediminis TaxID=1792834 RepID=A0ABV7JBL7_9GAMM|nr:hypothetical protein [Marinicella sediminis]